MSQQGRLIVSTLDAPKALAVYSQAIIAGGAVYTSGQIALDPASGEMVEGGVREQTARVLENMRAVLEAAGSGLELVVKTTCYLANMADFAAFNEVYATYFPSDPPARTTIGVAALPRGARVEVESVALLRT